MIENNNLIMNLLYLKEEESKNRFQFYSKIKE